MVNRNNVLVCLQTLICFICLPLTPVFAQQNSVVARLSGTVRDNHGAAVEDAAVSILNKAQKIAAVARTDERGEFAFELPTAVEYTVRVDKAGMNQAARVFDLSGSASLDFVLEPQSLTANVTVVAGGEFVTAESDTATRTPTALRDVPQSIEIVNQQLLQAQNARSMADALTNVTAVTVAQGEGRRDQFFIRGFNAIGDQFVDNVRDDAPYYRDLSNVEQIEVVKGPAAVLFGRGSSGGLINRVTKRPNLAGRVGGLELSGGSYGDKRAAFDFGQPILNDKLAFRFVGAFENAGGFRHNYFLSRYNIAPSLRWRVGERDEITFQFEYLNDQRLPDRGLPSNGNRPLDVPIATYYGFPISDGITNRVASQAIRYEHYFNQNWQIRNVFRHTGYATNFFNTGANGICVFASATKCDAVPAGRFSPITDKTGVARFTYNSSSKQNNYFNQTEIVGTFNTGGVKHTILGGFEFGAQERRAVTFNNNNANAVRLLNPDLSRLTTVGAFTITRTDFDATTTAGYVQDQISFTPRIKALVGVRYDRFEQRLDDLQFINPASDLRRVDKQPSPRVGVVYQPQEWLSLYASWTRSFQPSGENLSLAANNAQLEPETTRNYEVGVKTTIPKTRLNAALAVFRLDRDNIKTTDPNDSTKLILAGNQRTDGIEATVAGSPFRDFDFIAGFAQLSARILRSSTVTSGVLLQGRQAQLTPNGSGNFWMNYKLPLDLRIGFGAFARTRIFTSATNLVALPGFARFDAALFWRGERHFEIGFNVKNLTDKRYYETSNGDNQILPGAPINFSITTRYRW